MSALLLGLVLGVEASGSAGFALTLPPGWREVPAEVRGAATEARAVVEAGGLWLLSTGATGKVRGTIILSPVEDPPGSPSQRHEACSQALQRLTSVDSNEAGVPSALRTTLGEGCQLTWSPAGKNGQVLARRTEVLVPFQPGRWLRVSCQTLSEEKATQRACHQVLRSLRAR